MRLFETGIRFAPRAGAMLLILLACGSALAERADRTMPTVVDADQMVADDLKQTNVFNGNVVLTKGSMSIRADQLTVREDPEGYQFGTAIATGGKLVTYRQKREGANQYIEGVAERMEYDGKTDRIKLFQRAVMKRLEGKAETDEVRGDIVEYDSRTEVYTVSGGAKTGPSSGRVRAVIQPRNQAPVAAPASKATAAPASPR